MSISHLEFLVEEYSAEVLLQQLLPKLVGDRSFVIHAHQCKDELIDRLPGRLNGYRNWLGEQGRVVVLVDRDDDDCLWLKARLDGMAERAGILTRSSAGGGSFHVANRIVVEELEAWYFGDWQAVRGAYPRVSAHLEWRYRDPDSISGGTWEALERVLQRAGYFEGGLRKAELARAVGPKMVPDRNTSPSFRAFRDVVLEMAAA